MASPDINLFKAGIQEIEGFAGEVFTWPTADKAGSADYPCCARGPTKGGLLEQFGYSVQRTLTIDVRPELFPADPPARGQTLSFRGATYRIDSVQPFQADALLRLNCVDDSRGV